MGRFVGSKMTENTKKPGHNQPLLKTLIGCFAVFTICYALFHFATDYLGIYFDKDSNIYKSSFIFAYLLVNLISWPFVKKYFN